MKMFYFDNAATTMLKPPCVAQAVSQAIATFGGVGRGAHGAALSADMAVFKCRKQLAELFGAPDLKRVTFAQNATMALNEAISGLVGPKDHAITTAASHNSVLRPLFRAVDERGAHVSVLPVAPDASIDLEAFDALFQPDTKVAVVTHASNLTGDVYNIAAMARIAHSHGALICVDAAQTAGLIDINMARDEIDVLAFTGHKSLYGPQGTGGLVSLPGVEIPSFMEGGSGVHSYDRRHPSFYPERMEAGTLNGHGIAGLSAALEYIDGVGVAEIARRTRALAQRFEEGVRALPNVRVYGGHGGIDRTGVVALNIGDLDSAEVADALSAGYDICTRPGAHCAPLMHQALGTEKKGAVRFSFSHLNTIEEVDAGIAAVAEIAAGD